MTARPPLVILPRELGQVPPPVGLIGHKARGLAQLLALKARVPRFGILTAEAFDAHAAQDDVKATVAAAHASGFPDEASRLAHGEAMVRSVLRNPLPVAVRIGVHELLSAFAEEDLLAVRASVVGEPLEAAVVTGALDSALGIKGKDALEEAVLRIIALAFHPRTLGLREAAGLPAIGCRLAVVVQRMVLSESSGVCVSLEATGKDMVKRPTSLVRGCWGLAGGIGGKLGSTRIPSDILRIERPAVAADGIDDDARVETEVAQKTDQLKLDEKGTGTRMQPVLEHLRREPCVSPVQARMVAKEALRLEAAFGKPQVMSWSFAGRLLHILDVEPLLVPVSRIESERQRTWDDRLLPAGLLAATTPLTFSVWQRAAARGVERAGRILGVKGVILEDTRPQMPRLMGQVSGRLYGNVEVLTALLDLLPFADKARAALAAATGQAELVPRRAPPPGFWQRQRQKLDEGRWAGQLDKLSELSAAESERFRGEVEATLDKVRNMRPAATDPDTLIDVFDELEDALSKIVAALVLSGLSAMLHKTELDAVTAETELAQHPGITQDLLGGEVPGDLVELSRRTFAIVDLVRRRPALEAMLTKERGHLDGVVARLLDEAGRAGSEGKRSVDGRGSTSGFAVSGGSRGVASGVGAAVGDLDEIEPTDGKRKRGLSDDERRLADELRAIIRSPAATCTGELTIEGLRLWERPDVILETVMRLLPAGADASTLEALSRASSGARKKAEYVVEQAAPRLKSGVKKRFSASLDGVRKHGRDAALLWMPAENIIDRLRVVGLALGERLFEHGLLDQPRDFLYLMTPELAGLVRGTSVDQDGKPVVAARKRQAASRPMGLPRRLETKGVVATSLLNDDDEPQVTSPGDAKELSGRSVASGVVNEASVLLDGNPLKPGKSAVPGGVVVVRAPTLGSLPLMLVARAVVAERGTIWGAAAYALRACGVPTVVDAPQATGAFTEGEALVVDGGRGTVKRAGELPQQRRPLPRPNALPAPVTVDPHIFAREAVISDPRQRPAAKVPAAPLHDTNLRMPPVMRPASVAHSADEDFALIPRGTTPDTSSKMDSSDLLSASLISNPHIEPADSESESTVRKRPPPLSDVDLDTDDEDILERTDIEERK